MQILAFSHNRDKTFLTPFIRGPDSLQYLTVYTENRDILYILMILEVQNGPGAREQRLCIVPAGAGALAVEP